MALNGAMYAVGTGIVLADIGAAARSGLALVRLKGTNDVQPAEPRPPYLSFCSTKLTTFNMCNVKECLDLFLIKWLI